MNTTQARNYFTIAAANPRTVFALWTKNPWIITEAMTKYGINKPDNLIIIMSSALLNTAADVPAEYADIIDKVFTVYDKEHAEAVGINCGARNCNECRRCYTKTAGLEHVNELLK